MQWTHNDEANRLANELFSNEELKKQVSSFREIFDNTPIVKEGGETFLGGYVNQRYAFPRGNNMYNLKIGIVINYKESTRQSGYVLVDCMYNKKTHKLTKINAQYALGQYARTTQELKTLKTGTFESLYSQIGLKMSVTIMDNVKAYWKGFSDYYANKKTCGYYLD